MAVVIDTSKLLVTILSSVSWNLMEEDCLPWVAPCIQVGQTRGSMEHICYLSQVPTKPPLRRCILIVDLTTRSQPGVIFLVVKIGN